MSAALRKALLWLLMLTLPSQGIAAVGMIALHTLEGDALQMRQALATNAASFAEVSSIAPQAAKHCERMTAACDDQHVSGHLNCALAAVCALSAAPASQIPAFLQSAVSGAPIPAELNPRVTFSTGAPDRPPRSLL